MNKNLFGANLIKALSEMGIEAKTCKYIICPVVEEGKKYSSKDDFIRLNVFPIDKISNHIFSYEEILQRFSVLEPYYPLWIKVLKRDDNVIELQISLRFRKRSEVLKAGTGMEPFKVISD